MLEIFGAATAAMMVSCYALEERGVRYTWAFSASCALAAGDAFALGSWPFFVLEALWALVAARRAGRCPGRERVRKQESLFAELWQRVRAVAKAPGKVGAPYGLSENARLFRIDPRR